MDFLKGREMRLEYLPGLEFSDDKEGMKVCCIALQLCVTLGSCSCIIKRQIQIHTHPLSHTHSHTHPHTHILSHIHTNSITHTHIVYTHSPLHTLSHIHTLILTHSLSHTHTSHTYTHSHSYIHSFTLTYTQLCCNWSGGAASPAPRQPTWLAYARNNNTQTVFF